MTRRAPSPAALAAGVPSVPADDATVPVPAVSPVLDAPAGACNTSRRPAPRIEDLPDVLTDRDLCALLQVGPRWCEVQRREAKRAGVAPNLPATLPGMKLPRYRKADVEFWMRTGRSVPAPVITHRRVS